MGKKKILFVGSFKETSKDGGVGGQMFACKTIINSQLSDYIEWTLIDTTADSNILASTFVRVKKALIRLVIFTYRIVFFRYDHILIFVADGWSFWEKGVMGLLAKSITNSKIVIAPRSGLILNDLKKEGKLAKFIPYIFKKVDIVVCQSKYWKDLFVQITQCEDHFKFVVIENMINFDIYKNLPLRDSLNKVTGSPVTILFMAWVTKNKGIFELVEAVNMLKKDNVNFKVLIAGMGNDYDQIVEEVKKYELSNSILFLGWILGSRKIEILSEADIFVLPTYFDGYPNSLMEAMASGKACIATKVGSIPDMINNMENGIIIDKQNVKQLYESLKLLIENNGIREKISVNAREHVKITNAIPVGILKYKNIFVN